VVSGPDGKPPLPWLAAPLAQMLAQQRGHALLVHAAPGIGALPFVLALAQGWLCEAEATHTPRPCGQCAGCRLLQSRSHPDLRVLLPEAIAQTLGWAAAGEDVDGGDGSRSKKKPSRQIRIDEVRAAIDWTGRTSSRGGAKVVVIHPAEAMNTQSASALLKTLEEPPGGARLLLSCAQPEQLLPTVRSRCQRVVLPAPSAAQAVQWLLAQGLPGLPDERSAAVLLAATGGLPLDVLDWLAAGVSADSWAALPAAVAAGRLQALAGWPLPRAIDALSKLCHDAMVQAAGGAPRHYPSVPAGAGLPALAGWSQQMARAARSQDHPWNEALRIEALLGQGAACWRGGSNAQTEPADAMRVAGAAFATLIR